MVQSLHAQDILQNEMRNILAGIPNQINIADDILMAGSEKEHDQGFGACPFKIKRTWRDSEHKEMPVRRRRNTVW